MSPTSYRTAPPRIDVCRRKIRVRKRYYTDSKGLSRSNPDFSRRREPNWVRFDIMRTPMTTKRLLIILPVILIGILIQSFFWVPTYDKQATGNPERLIKFIESSSGDARLLNPALHADTASGDIVNLVFDGLLDLDDQLNLRPRLAESWTQYEEITSK